VRHPAWVSLVLILPHLLNGIPKGLWRYDAYRTLEVLGYTRRRSHFGILKSVA